MKSHCLGRFDFGLPAEFAELGRSQSAYSVVVTTIPLDGRTADEVWSDRLREIRALPQAARDAERPIRPVKAGPDYAVSYRSNLSAPHLITLEAQRAFDNHVLRVRCEGKADLEEDIQSLVKLTIDDYRPGASVGFCVGAGSIVDEAGPDEQALASYRNHQKGVEISIRTEPVGAVPSSDPLEDIAGDQAALGGEGERLDVLKNGARVLGGLSGQEGKVAFDSPQEGRWLRYSWFFQGVRGDGRQPEIRIKAVGPREGMDYLDEVWEALLTSFRPRR